MKSRGVRIVLLLVAIAALAAAGVGVWQIEQRMAAAQSAADNFEREARQAVVSLGEWRAAQQAYVAEGQPPGVWMTRTTGLGDAIAPKLSALRVSAKTAEAQGVLESAVEAFSSLMQSDARARDYVKAGQRLSASDVIFVEAAPSIEKAIAGIDTARGQEGVAHAVAVEALRRWELIALGAAAAVALLVMLLLLPLPRGAETAGEAEASGEDVVIPKGAGLRLSQDLGDGVVRRAQPIADAGPLAEPPAGRVAGARAAARADGSSKDDSLGPFDFGLEARDEQKGPDLDAVADLCVSFARVQDTRELQGLLERVSKTLDATGVIVWMPDGPQGTLRPVLAHGYAPLALSRMGTIHPASDNATATAYRTKSVVVVPAEVLASGAVVAPLISAEGCSGAMAVELREGVEASSRVRAVTTIVAAQLATLFTPGAVTSAAADPAASNA
jgi:hypothetical protein